MKMFAIMITWDCDNEVIRLFQTRIGENQAEVESGLRDTFTPDYYENLKFTIKYYPNKHEMFDGDLYLYQVKGTLETKKADGVFQRIEILEYCYTENVQEAEEYFENIYIPDTVFKYRLTTIRVEDIR